jgi:hypothetical protein
MIRALAVALLAALPLAAAAHSPMPGFEGFYVGLVHPLTVPGHALVLVVVGLVLGLRGPAAARTAFALFLVTLCAGAALGRGMVADATVTWIPLAVALGGALLLLVPAGLAPASMLSALGGLVVGHGSLPDPGPTGAVAITLTGSLVGAPFLLLCAFGVGDVLRERLTPWWSLTVARVVGGWLVAIATLLLALELRAAEALAYA